MFANGDFGPFFKKKSIKITRICLIFSQGNIEANFTCTTVLFI